MPTTQAIEPITLPPAPTAADQGPAGRRVRRGVIPCSRCRTPLPYLIERTRFRVMLSCSRCGTQTPKPTLGAFLLKVATFVLSVAAMVIVAYAATHQGPPQAPQELREMTLGAPE